MATDTFIMVTSNRHSKRVMVFNATFNNNQLYRGGQLLLVKDTGEPLESQQPVVSH
jgi:hypothetical protein